MLTSATILLNESTAATPPPPIWAWVVLAVLVMLLLAALIWALVVWQRRRRASAPAQATGPSLGARLRDLGRPFYNYLPRRALHFPTVVVVGEAGVGKSHAIGYHVDWRGQADQFAHNVVREGPLQLYLGPDTVVHELSAPLLRDVSRSAKRALEQLWTNMGPSATVVVVLDARTLATTPPAALRELAQLVRGKIGLFPRRCQTALELRVCLAHLDQIDGYDEFAASVGAQHGPLDLGLLGPGYGDASRLVAAFDGHLAYALTKRTGPEFDRLVRFYGVLPELLGHLRPLLAALHGKDEPFGAHHRIDSLYLGAIVPSSHVGNPFVVAREQIATSIDHHNRRGLRGGLLTAAGGLVVAAAFFATHLVRVERAEAALIEFEQKFENDPNRDPLSWASNSANKCTPSDGPLYIREDEATAANSVTEAVSTLHDSENFWLRRTFVDRKLTIEQEFEATIRIVYLYPLIPGSDRIRLLYIMGLLYGSRDNDLGRVVVDNKALWARELGLSPWVIESYVRASDADFGSMIVPLCSPSSGGAEWSEYLGKLKGALGQDVVSDEELTELAKIPALRSQTEYAVLGEIRELLANETGFPSFYRGELVERPLDRWSEQDYVTLERLTELLHDQLGVAAADTSGWGLAELVTALSRPPLEIEQDFAVEVDAKPVQIVGAQLAGLLMRSRSHLLIDQVLAGLDERVRVGERRRDGRAFFAASFNPAKAGVVKGYGGGPRDTIDGHYTRVVFENQVTPVLLFASDRLQPQIERKPDLDPNGPAPAPAGWMLTDEDANELEREIVSVADAYAIEYRGELFDYYHSFELNPTSEMTLPFIFKAFVQPSSWFTDFLLTVTYHASPTLPDENRYFTPMREALAEFTPLADLLVEDKGVIAGLEPYQKLLADLQLALSDEGLPMSDAPVLGPRLSPLGQVMLEVLQASRTDHDAQVRQWLFEAGLDTQWHDPFRAPVIEAQALGIQNIQWELTVAWTQEVRPLVRPMLQDYPFNPLAGTETSAEEIEALVRKQGKEPGEFWLTFDRLLGPVTTRDDGDIAMLRRLKPPPGMLTLIQDLERMSRTLWDEDGARVPHEIVIKPLALPKDPHDNRTAALAYVSSAGGAVHGFNQRPESQTLKLEWWNQDTSVVALEMRTATGGDSQSYSIAQDGPFSFYRLLDQATNPKSTDRRATLTETAINAATRCYPGDPSGTKNLTIYWRVPIDDVARTVRVVLVSDPWAPFAVRDCGW